MDNARELIFPLNFIPRSLKELLFLLENDPDESRNTSMMYWNKTLFLSYDSSGTHKGINVHRPKDDKPDKLVYLELDDNIAFDSIRRQISLYNFAVNCPNCHIRIVLKGKKLSFTIIPLDKVCTKALDVMEKTLYSSEF